MTSINDRDTTSKAMLVTLNSSSSVYSKYITPLVTQKKE